MVSVSNFVSDNCNAFTCTTQAFLPNTALIPLLQTDDATSSRRELLVREGEQVAEGQIIAHYGDAYIHASIPGIVQKLVRCQYPNGKQGAAISIALAGVFSYTGKRQKKNDWTSHSPALLCQQLAQMGVVNTFVGCKSLSRQLSTLHPKSARLLVLRLFDDDPSRIVERFLAKHETEKIAEGVAIIAQAMDASGIVIVYGKKNTVTLPIERFTAISVASVTADTNKYPAGFEKDIAHLIKKQCKQDLYQQISARDIYIDAETAICAYEAVALSKPMMERYVHITGDSLHAAAVLRVKIGTSMQELADLCGGFCKPPARIIINGLVTGNAVSSLKIPVTKQVKSVQFQTASFVEYYYEEPCNRCGNCRAVCPNHLYPDMMYSAFIHGEAATDRERLATKVANLCTRCGLCSAACPARLPLCQAIPLLKKAIHEQ